MIKFFRKIRERLIAENRFTRYLLYAVGEIILVVIGILIAFQVSSWNEERKLKKLEISYYENLLADLRKDSTEFRQKSDNTLRNEQKLLNILRFIESGYDIEKSEIDEVEWRGVIFKDTAALAVSLSHAGFVQFPKLFENTMSDLRSTGNIKLLSNTDLKNSLVIYYNREKMFQDWNESYIPNRTEIDLVVNRILPWKARVGYNMNENRDFERSARLQEKYPVFLKNFQNEESLKGLVVGMIHVQYRIRDQAYNRLRDLDELIASVSREVDVLKSR